MLLKRFRLIHNTIQGPILINRGQSCHHGRCRSGKRIFGHWRQRSQAREGKPVRQCTPMINNPPPFKGPKNQIPKMFPIQRKGFINQGSGLCQLQRASGERILGLRLQTESEHSLRTGLQQHFLKPSHGTFSQEASLDYT